MAMARRRPRGRGSATSAVALDQDADEGTADEHSDESAVCMVSRVNAGMRRIDDLVRTTRVMRSNLRGYVNE